jgi:hypothetical protein
MKPTLQEIPLEIKWQIFNHLRIQDFFALRRVSKWLNDVILSVDNGLSIPKLFETHALSKRSLEILLHTNLSLIAAIVSIKAIIDKKNTQDYAKRIAIVEAAKDPIVAIATVFYERCCLFLLSREDWTCSYIAEIADTHKELRKSIINQAFYVAIHHADRVVHNAPALLSLGAVATQDDLDHMLSAALAHLLQKIANLESPDYFAISENLDYFAISYVTDLIEINGAKPKKDELMRVYAAAVDKGPSRIRCIKKLKELIDKSLEEEISPCLLVIRGPRD